MDHETEGFLFLNEEDMLLAQKEKRQITYIQTKLDYNNIGQVFNIYNKAIKERLFVTPIGINYLRTLQEYLQENYEFKERISPIPIYDSYHMKNNIMKEVKLKSDELQKIKKKEKGITISFSIILNILLILAIIFMFTITMKSDHPNIMNYKTTILTKYASWDQELTERELVIREKERELKIINSD